MTHRSSIGQGIYTLKRDAIPYFRPVHASDSCGRSGKKKHSGPAAASVCVQHAVMKPVGLAAPELDAFCKNSEARPVRRSRHFAGIALGQAGDPSLQHAAALERARLVGCQRAELAAPGTGVKIRVGLRSGNLLQGTFDADLASQGFPVKAQGSARIRAYLQSLPAFRVGVEEERGVRSDSLEQDHPDGGTSIWSCGGERHGIRIVRLAGLRLCEPGMQAGEWVRCLR